MKRLRLFMVVVVVGLSIYLGARRSTPRQSRTAAERKPKESVTSVRPREDKPFLPRSESRKNKPADGARQEFAASLLLPELPSTPETEIWQTYQSLATNQAVNLVACALQMLGSTNPAVRMTGAIFTIESQRGLNHSQIEQIAADEAVVVPLTALGWLRDAGLYACASQLEDLYLQRTNALELAAEALRSAGLNPVAGRAALRLIDNSQWGREEKKELMLDVLADSQTHPFVRWHAALRLRYQTEFSEYQGVIRDAVVVASAQGKGLRKGFGLRSVPRSAYPATDDPIFRLAMQLVNERTSGPLEVMTQDVTLTRDDADLIFAHESSLMLENLAAWLELATEKDRFVSVKRGFTSAVKDYLSELPRDELPACHFLALRRIEAYLPTVELLEKE